MKLRAKFSLTVVGLLAGAIGLVSGIMFLYQYQALTKENDRQNQELVRRLARVSEEALYQSDVIVLNYLKEISKERGVFAACVADSSEHIIAHTDPKQIGSRIDLKRADIENRSMRVYSNEVKLGASTVGTAYVFINAASLNRILQKELLRSMAPLLIISGVVLLIGVLCAIFAASTLIKPIETIVDGMRGIAKGSLEPMPPLRRNDEIGWMAEELNVMTAQLKEVDEMKKEFISSVTHELRSPLTAIDRFASLLLQQFYGPLTVEQREPLVTVKNNTIRLKNFIDDVLTSARMESRNVDMYFEDMDVRDVINEVHALFAPVAAEKKLALKIDVPERPLMANIDRLKMTQVLTNLVSNAIKFTKEGTITIAARENGDVVDFDVRDTGPGISDPDKAQLFQRFFRAKATAHSHSGTGLGLAIVKGLVELHNGQIHVLDNIGTGTIFRVTIKSQTP